MLSSPFDIVIVTDGNIKTCVYPYIYNISTVLPLVNAHTSNQQ